jgi:RNA polymerase sigma-70 factor (ECF subfamily)
MTRMQETLERPQPAPISKADERAFRDGLVEIIPALRAFARSLCGHRDLADDLAQEALARAWQARERFQPGTNLKAWVFVILRNEFYSNHRRAKTAADYSASYGQRSEGIDAEQHAKLDLTDLMRAFHMLQPEQKEALILTASEFSYNEAAEICGCAVGTIKSRVSRARKQLQLLVEGDVARLPGRESRASEVLEALFSRMARTAPEKG